MAVLLAVCAAMVFKLLIGGSTVAILNPAGSVALHERNLIIEMVLIMLIVVVPTLIILYAFAWRYREDNPKAKYYPNQWYRQSHTFLRELVLWAIPAVVVAVLWVLTWGSAHALDPYNPIYSTEPPLTIQVVALQWKWLFIYPAQHIATVNVLEIPENTPIHFELTADGPMSSFWIPQLGSQIYAMAAMQTQLNLMADKTGEFTGKDTEINGAGYAGMTFAVRSVSHADFTTWVTSIQQSSSTLDQNAYNALVLPSEYDPAAYYSSVDSNLFDSIMTKYMAPASTTSAQMTPGMVMPDGMQM